MATKTQTTAKNKTFTLDPFPSGWERAGYSFMGWSESKKGSVQYTNNQTIDGGWSEDKTLYAVWREESEPQVQYTITLGVERGDGTVGGGGTYSAGQTIQIRAYPAQGYNFVRWDDGNAQNPRTLTVTSNKTIKAIFEVQATTYAVTLSVDPANSGETTGQGQYASGSTALITASPYSTWEFDTWSDGVLTASRTLTVSNNVDLSALFFRTDGVDYTETVDGTTWTYSVSNGEASVAKSGGNYAVYGVGDVVVPTALGRRPVTSTGFFAFSGPIKSVTFPDGLTSIGSASFLSLTGITSVSLPGSLQRIGGQAFEGCTGLSSLTIPPGVSAITGTPFKDCTALTSVYFPGRTRDEVTAITDVGGEESDYPWGLDPSAISVDGEPTTTYTLTLSVDPPNSGETTGQGRYEQNAWAVMTALPAPGYRFDIWSDVADSYSYIRGIKMDGDKTLTASFANVSTTQPDNTIGIANVDGTRWLFYIDDGVVRIKNNEGGIHKPAIQGGASGGVAIPSSLAGKAVTIIGSWAFWELGELTSVTIPNSVSSIQAAAFKGCVGLSSITIPGSVRDTEPNIFWDCSALTSVYFPGHTCEAVSGLYGYPWNLTGGCVIHCSDGDIAVSE